jgi:hypothetical protein
MFERPGGVALAHISTRTPTFRDPDHFSIRVSIAEMNRRLSAGDDRTADSRTRLPVQAITVALTTQM